jgi:DNA-binding HxlR family transcriptional regulator
MTTRTYNQYCGVAEAMDVIGERWTMLVLRDLLPGPQRFKDLADRQPAMATDLLTDRLRRLELVGLVRRVPLPTPARGSMYQLTERGEQIRPLMGELARLGATWLPPAASSNRRFDAAWALATVGEHFGTIAPTEVGLQVTCEGSTVSLVVRRDKSICLRYGALPGAEVSITGPTLSVLGILLGRRPFDSAAAAHVDISGTKSDVKAWIAALRAAAPESLLVD